MTTLTKGDLAQFTGTDHWYLHNIARGVTYTDGVKYVAETAGAYWLLDAIAIAQMTEPKVMDEPFQCWTLATDLVKRVAILVCDDGNGKVLYTQTIGFTDFPLDEIKFYVADRVILLPSEY